MSLKQKQTLSLQQKLSPQQFQSIRLLELPALQMEARIKEEVENNVVLEEDPQVEDVYHDAGIPDTKSRLNLHLKDTRPSPSSLLLHHGSLQEALVEQLNFCGLSPRDLELTLYMVGSIDEDGYLRRDLVSIADDIAFTKGIEVSAGHLQELLTVIQHLDPAGVGARDLRECLLLQLERKEHSLPARQLAHTILTDHYDLFVRHHYEKLVARLHVTDAQFRDALDEITHLSPKPGIVYGEDSPSDTAPTVIPDFILDLQDGHVELSLNARMPEVKINPRFQQMMRAMTTEEGRLKEDADRETWQFVKDRIERAEWFIASIRQRHDTLMRVMRAIVKLQKSYFEEGDRAKLRPMVLRDVAEKIGMDVSTVSRVTQDKYVQTPFGIISLKSLFAETVFQLDGKEVSSFRIKELLRECLEGEDRRDPLTDEGLMEILHDHGYSISRRTVAKYREQLGYSVARLRRMI